MRRLRAASKHADWLSLVEPTGSFLTFPVLARVFPNGLDRLDPSSREQVRERLPADFSDPRQRTAWIEWVLKDLLHWATRCRSGPEIPATYTHVAERGIVLRPDHALFEPATADREARVRALVCEWPPGTSFDTKVRGDSWAATPAERMAILCRATGVGVGLVTDGAQWRLVWAPQEGSPGGATFLAPLFSEEPAILDAFTSLLSARRFFSVAPADTIEALLKESATAQAVVADQLGKQVRRAAEMLVASISRANRERGGELLRDVAPEEVYAGAVTVLMRLIFLFFAEERGLLPLDLELYVNAYAATTLREQLQEDRDLQGDEPLERRSAAWYRVLALGRGIYGGLNHDALQIAPHGGRLFDPDRYPFLEGRRPESSWREDRADPIAVDDLTMLAVLTELQVLNGRTLSYRTLEVEQIGHVYEGLLDHSVKVVDEVFVGLVGRDGEEPEVRLAELEAARAAGRESLVAATVALTGKTAKQVEKLLDTAVSETERQALAAAVENDESLISRVSPFVHLLRKDVRELPAVSLPGSVFVTQTTSRREGGIEYTTRELADEVAQYALEPLVFSPGPQDGAEPGDWKLRSSAELLDLKICDPAVGSGSILVAAGRYLARRLIEAWVVEGAPEADGPDQQVAVDALRAVADRCLYGVDRDPLAAEMAKMSLWLTTMSKNRPFTFLDHAIRVGDSLLGVASLEQIRWMHLDPSAGRKLHHTLFDYTGALEPLVKEALERRNRLSRIRVLDIHDAEDKARLTAEADADLELLCVIGDLVVGAAISTATKKASDFDSRLVSAAHQVSAVLNPDLDAGQRERLVADLRNEATGWLNAVRPNTTPRRQCLHWPLAFPEVFLDRARPGFDALVGNPPFLGGKKISGPMGSDFRQFLVCHIANGKKGNADLVAYFFLRAAEVARTFGFLATNTIAQGDTREIGLDSLTEKGWVILRAEKSRPWPGVATLEISQVWLHHGEWAGHFCLDGEDVPGITAMLESGTRSGAMPRRLVSNRDHAYIGSLVNGIGFVLETGEAQSLIWQDERNRDVLDPYLNGEDLNSRADCSARRWVINFHDWALDEAERYADCLAVVRARVKPQRDKLPDYKRRVREAWWRYEHLAPALYRAISKMDRVLAVARVSKTVAPVFVARDQVFSEQVVAFAYDDDFHFGVLGSGFHFRWAIYYASSIRTDTRYTPSDVFDTFAQPAFSHDVAAAGQALHEHRSKLMIANNEGLTSTYNRVHNPKDETHGIPELRELHVALDLAVRDAYGWHDLELEHGFHPVRGQGIRFTFSPAAATEVLERLLELNKERYEAEVAAGLHASAKKKDRARRPKLAQNSTPSLFGDGFAGSASLAEDLAP